VPLVLLNLSVALGFLWFFVRQGLRPRYALAAALPVIAFTPVKAIEFASAYGAGIEPFLYALVLWLLRKRPVMFGALLGFGTLHREFTFLALPALAIAVWPDRTFRSWRSLAGRAGGFAAVWLVIDVLKRNINNMGPGGTFAAGSVTLGAKTFLSWLAFDGTAYAKRTWEIVTWGIPDMLGIHTYSFGAYSVIPPDMKAGSRAAAAALAIAVAIAVGRSLWLRFAGGNRLAEGQRQVAIYLASLAVLNILIYGLNGGIPIGESPILRYALFAPLLLVALFGAYFAREHSRGWRAGAAAALMLWAGANVVDNARFIREVVRHPPEPEHRVLADYLTAHGIHYARAIYWDAYRITFLTRENVIVASTDFVRISSYQEEVDRHSAEAYTLRRLPCQGGVEVAAWCVIPPDHK